MRRRDSARGACSGFTLLEMVVALLLTGIVALIARELFAQVMVGVEAIEREQASDLKSAERAWFLEACRDVETGAPGTLGFVGTSERVEFTSRMPAAQGWMERTRIVLQARPRGIVLDAGWLHAQLTDSGMGSVFDYLPDRGDEGWLAGWNSPVSVPVAIRMRWTQAGVSDSLLCVIGERG